MLNHLLHLALYVLLGTIVKAKLISLQENKITVRIQGIGTPIVFEIPEGEKFYIAESRLGNFLALVAFPFAMKKSLDLELEYPVDETLARNLHEFSVLWSQYRPERFKSPVKIASSLSVPSQSNGGIEKSGYAIAFSGGIDSTYAFAVNQFAQTAHPFEITQAIMIDGFGYDLEKKKMFEKQRDKNRIFLKQFDVGLTTVRTNWSKVVIFYQLFHTIGIAAVMNLFSQRHHGGIIGLDFTYNEEFTLGPWGNMALIDRLLSSTDFSIQPMGADKDRIEKLAFLNQKNAIEHLAVCNFMGMLGRNCSHCEKCTRTMLGFVSQQQPVPSSIFKGDVTVDSLNGIEIKKPTQYIFFKSLVNNWINPDVTLRDVINTKLSHYERRNPIS